MGENIAGYHLFVPEAHHEQALLVLTQAPDLLDEADLDALAMSSGDPIQIHERADIGRWMGIVTALAIGAFIYGIFLIMGTLSGL